MHHHVITQGPDKGKTIVDEECECGDPRSKHEATFSPGHGACTACDDCDKFTWSAWIFAEPAEPAPAKPAPPPRKVPAPRPGDLVSLRWSHGAQRKVALVLGPSKVPGKVRIQVWQHGPKRFSKPEAEFIANIIGHASPDWPQTGAARREARALGLLGKVTP